ncbi:MAG TPA: hypothetical protein VMA36_20215 [Candidatus Limnocylindria bacterium]|nr:hypothetical protein [Candidatus Limnocylindria bacterium]
MKMLAIMASAGLLAASPSSPTTAAHAATLSGTIAVFDGKYHLQLRDERGSLDDVMLHRGTVITPTGQPLTSGMHVTISGTTNGTVFDADEIDVADEDATIEYSPGPYTPLVGSLGTTPCTSWDCTCGTYSNGCFGAGFGFGSGYYPGYYPGYFIPYSVWPPVIIVPAPPAAKASPAPFHMRRPLDASRGYLVPLPQQQMPHRTVVPPPRPHVVVPRGGPLHR